MKLFVVKKYKNRKMYSPEYRTQVTLEDLRSVIREGRDIQVKSLEGEDLTWTILKDIAREFALTGSDQLLSLIRR